MAEKSGVQSVERIFQLIAHLAAHPTGVSLQRLAEEPGLAKSTVHRLLASLVGLGYVVQDEENGHYRLTLKMFELSRGIVDRMDIMGVAKAHLERLSQRTGEAVHLVIRDGRDIVYIYKTESGPMRMSSRVGLRSPLYCTGVGKAILATLPGDELEDIWTHSNVQKLTRPSPIWRSCAASWWRSAQTATPSTTRRTSWACAVWRWRSPGRTGARKVRFPSAVWHPI